MNALGGGAPRPCPWGVVRPPVTPVVVEVAAYESNDFLRAIWKGPKSLENGSVFLSAGGHKPDAAAEAAENDDLIVFGRYFTSNVSFQVLEIMFNVIKEAFKA